MKSGMSTFGSDGSCGSNALTGGPPLTAGGDRRAKSYLAGRPARTSDSLPLMAQTTESGEVLPIVNVTQFFAVDIRSAVITAVEPFPEARQPAYKLRLDLGHLGERVSSAQITSYEPDRHHRRLRRQLPPTAH